MRRRQAAIEGLGRLRSCGLRATRTCAGSSSLGLRRSSATGPSSSRSPSMRTGSAARRRSGSSSSLRLVPAALVAPFAGMLADRYPTRARALFTNLARIVLVGAAALVRVRSTRQPASSTCSPSPRRSRHAVPLRAGRAHALARTDSRGAHRCERRRERDREHRRLRRARCSPGCLLGCHRPPAVFASMHGAPRRRGLGALPPASSGAERTHAASSKRRRSRPRPSRASRRSARDSSLRVLVGLFTAQTFVAGRSRSSSSSWHRAARSRGRGRRLPERGCRRRRVRRWRRALSLTGAARLSPAFLDWRRALGPRSSSCRPGRQRRSPALVVRVSESETPSWTSPASRSSSALFPTRFSLASSASSRCSGSLSVGIGAALRARAHRVARRRDCARRYGPRSSPLLVVTSWRPSCRIDASAAGPERASSGSSLSPDLCAASGRSLEHLAARLVPLRVEAGTVIVREGDAGDRFYIVAEGEIDVSQGATLTGARAGGYFGEIALLRDVAERPP